MPSSVRKDHMSTTASKPAVVNARIEQRHAEQLRQIADRNASTISRIVGRILAESLDDLSRQTPSADDARR
jgi:hypothetical protein